MFKSLIILESVWRDVSFGMEALIVVMITNIDTVGNGDGDSDHWRCRSWEIRGESELEVHQVHTLSYRNAFPILLGSTQYKEI